MGCTNSKAKEKPSNATAKMEPVPEKDFPEETSAVVEPHNELLAEECNRNTEIAVNSETNGQIDGNNVSREDELPQKKAQKLTDEEAKDEEKRVKEEDQNKVKEDKHPAEGFNSNNISNNDFNSTKENVVVLVTEQHEEEEEEEEEEEKKRIENGEKLDELQTVDEALSEYSARYGEELSNQKSVSKKRLLPQLSEKIGNVIVKRDPTRGSKSSCFPQEQQSNGHFGHSSKEEKGEKRDVKNDSTGFSYDMQYKCFENGRLHRLVDTQRQVWAYCNSAEFVSIRVSVTFGPESSVEALGTAATLNILNAETGQVSITAIIPPGQTVPFMKGEYNGFISRYDVVQS